MKSLWNWLFELDRILRGEKTRVADLRKGEIDIPLRGITVILVILGMIYGLCMGCYAVINFGRGMQMFASMVKVPALFLLTLAVTMPSLYVFNAIVGSKLTVSSLARLFVAALGVNLALLSSLGPIVAFFSINTTSYSFMVLLNVLVFAVSGALSLAFLLQTLHRLNIAPRVPFSQPPVERRSVTTEETPSDSAISAEVMSESPSPENEFPDREVDEASLADELGPLAPPEGHVLGQHVKTVFGCWMVVFVLVGAQMSWVLRPFIGSPNMAFQWFRPRDSNFFEAVWKALIHLIH